MVMAQSALLNSFDYSPSSQSQQALFLSDAAPQEIESTYSNGTTHSTDTQRRRKEKMAPKDESAWSEVRSRIYHLYIVQDLTLLEVMEKMKTAHGFDAS